jgi:hypothetical protein
VSFSAECGRAPVAPGRLQGETHVFGTGYENRSSSAGKQAYRQEHAIIKVLIAHFVGVQQSQLVSRG